MSEPRRRRRIVKLIADEVSFVDDPAVPKAKFIIAKRRENVEDDRYGLDELEKAAGKDKAKDKEKYGYYGEGKKPESYGDAPGGKDTLRAFQAALETLDRVSGDLDDKLGGIVDDFLGKIEGALKEQKACAEDGKYGKPPRQRRGQVTEEQKAKEEEAAAVAAISQAFQSPSQAKA